MVGADVLARALREKISGGERAGLLLPNVNATPVVILALWSLGKVPAMLNFSSSIPTMLACAKLAGLKHIMSYTSLEDIMLQEYGVKRGGWNEFLRKMIGDNSKM